jgi:hypothetical protein
LRDVIIIILFFENLQMTLLTSCLHHRADMINTKTALAAIAIVSALALVVAPAMVGTALAAKKEVCTLPSGNPCPGATEDHNPQTDKKCVAGKDFQNDNPRCP